MVENELVLVLNNANRNAKLYGNTCSPLLNPASMFFEKYLFLLRYRFVSQKTALRLAVAAHGKHFLNLPPQGPLFLQFRNRPLCMIDERTTISQESCLAERVLRAGPVGMVVPPLGFLEAQVEGASGQALELCRPDLGESPEAPVDGSVGELVPGMVDASVAEVDQAVIAAPAAGTVPGSTAALQRQSGTISA